jgi:hypothetical protein
MFYFFYIVYFMVYAPIISTPGGLWITLTYSEEKARVCLVLILGEERIQNVWICVINYFPVV